MDWSSTAITCLPAPMANSISVAVGDSDTMRAGSDLIVTAPLPAVTVTGKLAAVGDAELAAEAVLAADALLAGDEVVAEGEPLLADDPQPARTAAQAVAVPRTAVILRGVLIRGLLPPVTGGKEGETAGAPWPADRGFAGTDRPSHEG